MLEMAILETQIFKPFWGEMPPDPLRKVPLYPPLCIPTCFIGLSLTY